MLMVSVLQIRIMCLENVYITRKVEYLKNILLSDYVRPEKYLQFVI